MRALPLCPGLLLLLVLPAAADEPPRAAGKTFEVPYNLSIPKHIVVRAKINGKGPFNFILDTGAPALFVSAKLCRKLDVEPSKQGWGTFDRFEIEGGVVIPKARGRVADTPQIEGMNAMGLAGVELHGVIGYNLLARYRMEIDFTKDKMTWTALAFDPPPPAGLGGGATTADEVSAMGGLVKMMGSLLGKKAAPEAAPRGFLGMELSDAGGRVTVTKVLEKGPAARAGLRAGDRVTEFDGKTVDSSADVHHLAAELRAGTAVRVAVLRGGSRAEYTITAGEGL
jgi:hypothetical protein